MRIFLREWFRSDERSLKAIDNGHFTMSHFCEGVIHPDLWQSVVRPDSHIIFSQQSPPEVRSPAPPQSAETGKVRETCYENRVQYKVSYYQRKTWDSRDHFVDEQLYSEPVELEKAQDADTVPVLEERKQVRCPPEQLGLDEEFSPKMKKRPPPRHDKLRPNDDISEPVLKIYSPYLLNILKAVIVCSAEPPEGDDKGLDAGLFNYPYMDLYLHLDDLLKYKAGENDLRKKHSDLFNERADQHIDLLQTYLESQPTIPYKEAKARWSGSVPVTTFGAFWLLMKPGTDVYVREQDGSLSRYVLDRLIGGTVKDLLGKKAAAKYTAQLWNLMLDEKAIRQYSRKVDIPIFDDEREITKLPVFPVRFHDDRDHGKRNQELIARGKKYFEFSKRPSFVQYSGQGLKPGSRSVSLSGDTRPVLNLIFLSTVQASTCCR